MTPTSSPALTRLRPSATSPRPAPSERRQATDGAATARPRPVPRRLAGRYRYERRSGTWTWSAEMSRLLGLPTAGVRPCTDLLVRHQHPADRARTLEAVAGACADGGPFSVRVQLSGGDGAVRTVVLLGEPVVDATGTVEAIEGLLVEVPTERPRPDGDDRVHALEAEVAQLRTAMASRATIEQAKGILMLLAGCGEQVAFTLLAHISSNTHRKVRDVATAITESAAGRSPLPPDVRSLIRDVCPPSPRMR